MPIYGQRARYLSTDHSRYLAIYVGVKFRPKTYIFLPNHPFSRCKMDFVASLLKDKTIILLNLAEYCMILAISAYGLLGYKVSGDIRRDFAG